MVEEGAPGVLVVVRDGDATRAEARGLADRARAVPMTPDVRFRAGSITKTFVAALVLDLAADGKLRLDDPVARWLPGLVPRGDEITVRQLLRHTSGLADYVDDPRVLRAPARRWRPEELVALAAAQAPAGAPGERFAYASTNYVVLGLVAERAGHAPLATLLARRLFAPLRLRHTGYVPGIVPGRSVHGYRAPSHQGVVTGEPVEAATAAWWAGAAGGIVSSAEDVQRFFAALLGGRLVGPRLLREMQTLVPAGRNRYGLGIAVFPTPCGPRGAARGTSRAPSPSRGTRATRRARSCSSSTLIRSRPSSRRGTTPSARGVLRARGDTLTRGPQPSDERGWVARGVRRPCSVVVVATSVTRLTEACR